MISVMRQPARGLLAVLLFGGSFASSGQDVKDARVIRINASMFHYSPARIELRTGVPVTLELRSLDRLHGFNIPDLGVRADVLPGQAVRVDILPEKAGRYLFLCDIFCGDGHDEMGGIIVVSD